MGLGEGLSFRGQGLGSSYCSWLGISAVVALGCYEHLYSLFNVLKYCVCMIADKAPDVSRIVHALSWASFSTMIRSWSSPRPQALTNPGLTPLHEHAIAVDNFAFKWGSPQILKNMAPL